MAFQGSRVYLCQSLVIPKHFDDLQNILKNNGAEVILSMDPCANSHDQFHVISSSTHEKFVYLRERGCNLIGPELIMQCAKEQRCFPKQSYSCCLAMEGVKILASGFDKEEKENILNIVTSMCGELIMRVNLDVDFVITKDVLATRYKWASTVLKKPVINIDWLHQCFLEHRLVPSEPYRMLPFQGLTICVSGIPPGKRDQIEQLVIQHGGIYSPNLTKKCTHLLCNIAEGEKYMVARNWRHIKIVNEKWITQSITTKACMNEELYPVQSSVLSTVPRKGSIGNPSKQAKECTESMMCSNIEDSMLQTLSSSTTLLSKETDKKLNITTECNESTSAHSEFVVADSQTDGDDLYLENCKIFFVGFKADEMRKLVSMVRSGGGSRYVTFNNNLSHVVVGRPSDFEMKEIRKLSASGSVYVVRPSWLEDCTRQRTEVEVTDRHISFENLSRQGMGSQEQLNIDDTNLGNYGSLVSQRDSLSMSSHISKDLLKERPCSLIDQNHKKSSQILIPEVEGEAYFSSGAQQERPENDENWNLQNQQGSKDLPKYSSSSSLEKSKIFTGYKFVFSEGFPMTERNEVIQSILLGEGSILDNEEMTQADFMIACHGARIDLSNHDCNLTLVSTHWIMCCLAEGELLDIESHILYRPLPCQIPLPGFDRLRICVTQYERKDRTLLRKLCYVLGAKFTEKLTKNVTHLLCKFSCGAKYGAACAWHIEIVTAEWINECIIQNRVVPSERFRPSEASKEDMETTMMSQNQADDKVGR